MGILENFILDIPIRMKISILGSNIEFYVNDVLIGSVQKFIMKSQLQLVLHSSKDIIVQNFRIHTDIPMVFVVMPFTDEYNQLYNEVIKPITERFGLKCVKADEFFSPGIILQDIINSIREASLIYC